MAKSVNKPAGPKAKPKSKKKRKKEKPLPEAEEEEEEEETASWYLLGFLTEQSSKHTTPRDVQLHSARCLYIKLKADLCNRP